MEINKVFKLNLHESIKLSILAEDIDKNPKTKTIELTILRVPSGWIYQIDNFSCFVPYSNQLKYDMLNNEK